jgi:hypothetical protein
VDERLTRQHFPGGEADESADGALGGQVGWVGGVTASAEVGNVFVIIGAIWWSDSAGKGVLMSVVNCEEECRKGKKASGGIRDKATAPAASAVDWA